MAEFVVKKLDVTTLPAPIRPKPEKNRKTFSDYGYAAHRLHENEVLVETTPGGSQINLRILEQNPSGLYVCVQGRGESAAGGQIQRVYFLKLKNANGLLRGRESWKEFDGCPAIGVDPTTESDSYGG